MALGRRPEQRQQEMWVATAELPKSEGHIFYRQLNELLKQTGFDPFVEELCRPYYHAALGRPGIPVGTYFRMLLVGYFEGLGSQRGIAWRCADSLSLRVFLGVPLTEDTPDHSSLTRMRDRLPLEVHAAIFHFVLQAAAEYGLLKGKTVAVEYPFHEAHLDVWLMLKFFYSQEELQEVGRWHGESGSGMVRKNRNGARCWGSLRAVDSRCGHFALGSA